MEIPEIKRGRGRPPGSKNRNPIKTVRESQDEKRYDSMNQTRKFTPSQQLEIARRIAWFWTNSEITEFARTEFQISISPSAIGEMRKSETWKPVVEQFREEYITKCGEVPLFHKRKRLEELQTIYEDFRNKKNHVQARFTLQAIRDEAEGKSGDIYFKFTSVTHNEFHQMTDEDLQKEKMKTLEQLEKVRRLKLLTNQGDGNGVGIEDAQEVKEVQEAGE